MGAMENENRITIPDFSKDDFLISSKPFQWIIDQADGNEFIKGQLVAQMADKAKELDVSNFRTQFKNYVRAQKGQNIVYGNVMEFSGTAIMWDTGEWIATDDGVYRFKGQFNEKVTACPHPIFMITRYSNVDTDVESVQLVYGRPGRNYKTKIVPRSDLASANKIVKLAEYGVGVTSENAKALVQFLSDFESINYDKIIEKKSCDHMGWVGRGFKEFAPYISDLEFEGQDSFRQLFNSVREVGSYEKWLKTIRDYRKNGNIVVRMVMAASFASVLLKPGFIVAAYLLTARKKLAKQGEMVVYSIFKKERAASVMEEIKYTDKVFSGFVNGKILDAFVIALICFISLKIFTICNPGKEMMSEILIAFIVGIFNVIPFFGWYIAWFIGALLCLIVNPAQCLFFVIFNFILQQIDGNIIGPKILGNTTGISSFWVLFAILLFGDIWGFAGMLLGVPIFAVIYHLIKKWVFKRLQINGMENLSEEYEVEYPPNEREKKLES